MAITNGKGTEGKKHIVVSVQHLATKHGMKSTQLLVLSASAHKVQVGHSSGTLHSLAVLLCTSPDAETVCFWHARSRKRTNPWKNELIRHFKALWNTLKIMEPG